MIMDNLDDPRQEPYQYRIGALVYVWHGGAYIDVCTLDPGGDLVPTDVCLNVWDYETDVPTIDRSREAFLATIGDDLSIVMWQPDRPIHPSSRFRLAHSTTPHHPVGDWLHGPVR